MRHTAAEKYEIIRLVEGSDLPARRYWNRIPPRVRERAVEAARQPVGQIVFSILGAFRSIRVVNASIPASVTRSSPSTIRRPTKRRTRPRT